MNEVLQISHQPQLMSENFSAVSQTCISHESTSLFPSKKLGKHTCNHLITTAIPQARDVIFNRFPCVVISLVEVFCYLIRRCRRCESNDTVMGNMDDCRALTACDSCIALCQPANQDITLIPEQKLMYSASVKE